MTVRQTAAVRDWQMQAVRRRVWVWVWDWVWCKMIVGLVSGRQRACFVQIRYERHSFQKKKKKKKPPTASAPSTPTSSKSSNRVALNTHSSAPSSPSRPLTRSAFKSLQSRVSARLSAHKPSVLDLGEVVKQKSKSKSKAKNKSKAKGLRGSV